MGIGKDLGGSLLGLTETAYLVVLDQRSQRLAPDETNPYGYSPADAITGLAKKVGKSVSAVSGALAKLTNVGVNEAEGIERYSGATSMYFKVQFNPAELSLNSSDRVIPEANLQNGVAGAENAGTTQGSGGTNTLSVNLYFDDMNKSDAFTSEKFKLSASSVATTVGKVFGASWSVQPQVEALTSALRNPATRQVSFYWSDFCFTGSLHVVSAQYTMFSITGQPIRAKVSLRIDQNMDPHFLEHWNRDFNKAFGQHSNLGTIGQKVGGVLGLNL